jgi:hypothetical protein
MADMTPATALELLERRLDERWATRMSVPDRYFEGDHPLRFATSKFREAFGGLLREMADNWCPLIVSSTVERLKVQGFRFGQEQGADDDAWAIWQANGLDAESDMAHTEAVKLGEAYWLVAPPAPGTDVPIITAEHPSQMIVATAPGNRRVRLAALKRWADDDGYGYATLYLPDVLHKWRSKEKLRNGGQVQWVRREDDPGGRNPLGEVPVVPLRNAPSMLSGGRSDLAPAVPIFDAINKLCADMTVAAEYAAYRQRVMTGVEQPRDANGKPLPIELGVSRLFTVEAPDAKVFDLAASDLKNYVQAIEMWVQHLAAQTKTPPHYLLSSMVNASGDALSVAESGLVSKVRDKMVTFGEGHEEAMRLAFKAVGDEKKATAMDAETLWRDPERRSYAQVVDAATKMKQVGLAPDEILWEEIGWSPQKIARAKTMQIADSLFNPVGTPANPQNPNGTPAANAGV